MNTDSFFSELKPMTDFSECADLRFYRTAPQDWFIATSDLVNSTKAIDAGKYHAINSCGVASITAVMNACGDTELPFIFGGDGATILFPGQYSDDVRNALKQIRAMALDGFDLDFRIGIVSIEELHAGGHKVMVGRYNLSGGSNIAFFAGDGTETAENWLKSGRLETIEGPLEKEASYLGFNCRWEPLPARNDCVVAVLIQALREDVIEGIKIYDEVLVEIQDLVKGWHNVIPVDKAKLLHGAANFNGEREYTIRSHGKRLVAKWLLKIQIALEISINSLIIKVFHPFLDKTIQRVTNNSDFQKFDGMIRMILDLSETQYQHIVNLLEERRERGELIYGIHKTDSALFTCMVRKQECHFLDAANGGYAMAAKQYKEQAKAIQRSN